MIFPSKLSCMNIPENPLATYIVASGYLSCTDEIRGHRSSAVSPTFFSALAVSPNTNMFRTSFAGIRVSGVSGISFASSTASSAPRTATVLQASCMSYPLNVSGWSRCTVFPETTSSYAEITGALFESAWGSPTGATICLTPSFSASVFT